MKIEKRKYLFFILYFVVVLLFGIGCVKIQLNEGSTINNPALPNGLDTSNISGYYFFGEANFEPIFFESNANGNSNFSADTISYGFCEKKNIMIAHLISLKNKNSKQEINLRFLECEDFVLQGNNVFATNFIPKAYPFGSSNLTNLESGVEIEWIDNYGKAWKTVQNTGYEYNQVFQIIEIGNQLLSDDKTSDFTIKGVIKNVYLYSGVQFVILNAYFLIPVNLWGK